MVIGLSNGRLALGLPKSLMVRNGNAHVIVNIHNFQVMLETQAQFCCTTRHVMSYDW